MIKKQLKPIAFIVLAISISVIWLIQQNHLLSQSLILRASATFSTPTPTAAPPNPVQTTNMVSPDGKMMLIMRREQDKDQLHYEFSTTNQDSSGTKLIYKKAVNLPQTLSLPYNSWSPDNKYFFIKEDADNFYVFSSSGEMLNNDTKYVDITSLFKQKLTEFRIEDITGWAAPNLLLVNTRDQQNNLVSFWFEIPSQSFIRLSSQFN